MSTALEQEGYSDFKVMSVFSIASGIDHDVEEFEFEYEVAISYVHSDIFGATQPLDKVASVVYLTVDNKGVSCSVCPKLRPGVHEWCAMCEAIIEHGIGDDVVATLINRGATFNIPLDRLDEETTLFANVKLEKMQHSEDYAQIIFSSLIQVDKAESLVREAGGTFKYSLGTIRVGSEISSLMYLAAVTASNLYDTAMVNGNIDKTLLISCSSRRHRILGDEGRRINNVSDFARFFFTGKCETCSVIDAVAYTDIPF